MTEPAPTPRFYAPTEPDPEKGLIPAVRTIRRELMKQPQPVTAAAVEIEQLRSSLADASIDVDRYVNSLDLAEKEIERLRAENIETLKTANRLTLALEAAEAALATARKDEHFTAALAALEEKT